MRTKLLLLLLFSLSLAAQPNLVPNGSFENWTNNTTVPGWTTQNNVTQNTTDYVGGLNSIRLSFTSNSSIPKITAPVSLSAGATYTVKFKYKYLSSNYNGSHPIILTISKNGSLTTLSNNSFAADNNWTRCETTFTPDQNLSYDLSISLLTNDGIGFNAAIDDVQVYVQGTEQYTLIPDLNFEKKLIALDIDSGTTDGKVLTSSISALTTLNLTTNVNGPGLYIKDLTGIQDFTSLRLLICSGHELTTLNLTKNTALTTLNCQNNLLTNLDISKNSALTSIICSNNKLTTLDVSAKLALTKLQCASNKLASLDVLKNTALITLNCENNLLTSLEVSKNTALITLDCSKNLLTNLDASKNAALTSLYCQNNSLTSVDLKNGNNTAFYWNFIHHLSFYGNKNLKCITVDNVVYSNRNWAGNKEYESTYAMACDGRYTSVPDPLFEQELIDLGLDSGDLDGKVITANISSVKTLNLFSKNITDLTGIEDFTELTSLYCNNNKLSSLNISKNIALTTLRCSNNYKLDILDVSNNVNLEVLYCNNLKIRTLNLSNNLKLRELNCSYNALTILEIPHNPDFTYIDCSNNRLSNLDVSTNIKLNYLNCAYNKILGLDLSENYLLTDINCSFNNLFNLNVKSGNNVILKTHNFRNNPNLKCISVDKATINYSSWQSSKDTKATYSENCSGSIAYTLIPDPAFEQKLIDIGIDTDGKNGKVLTANIALLKTLDISSSNITDITGIKDFTSLTYLDCGTNGISLPDFSENVVLTTLYCSKNYVKKLDLSKNIFLTYLDCSANRLSSIDVSKQTALTYLNVSNNKGDIDFTSLDVSGNTALTTLNCSNNKLVNLDVAKNLALTTLYCNNNQIDALDISINKSLIKIDCQNNNLWSLNLKNGNNLNFDTANSNFTNNLTLTCIKVDNTSYSNANWAGLKDASVSFDENCNIPYTLIPDINFENRLIALKIDSGAPDGKIATARINTITYLEVNGASIADLTGIQDFTALTILNFQNNQVTAIDISKNLALTELYAGSNKITTLDASSNLALTELQISNNKLTSINVSKNINLTDLFCVSNQLTVLNLSNNKKLNNLRCASNQLTNLDLSGNQALHEINCSKNNLSTVNIKNTNNRNLTNNYITLNFTENPLLKCIQVDDEAYSNANWADKKDITAVYLTNCSSLGIEESVFSKVVIHPNPTKGEVNINNASLQKANVYNTLGQLVKSFTLNPDNTENTINLSGLPKGVYYVYLINQDAASAKKVIVE